MAGNVPQLLKGGYESRAARKQHVAVGLLHLERQRLDATFNTFDKNHSGKLERDEVRELLKERNAGVPPDEDELTFILMSTRGQRASASEAVEEKKARRGKSLHRKELDQALTTWEDCRSWRLAAEIAMDEYAEGHHRLGREGLRQCLGQLSAEMGEKGRYAEVNDQELDAVLSEAAVCGGSCGKLTRPEVGLALQIWHSEMAQRIKKRPMWQSVAARSAACVVS